MCYGTDVNADVSHNNSHIAKKLKLVLSPKNWQEIALKNYISSGRVY